MNLQDPEKQPSMDLPPIDASLHPSATPTLETSPVKQLGTERNPELLQLPSNQGQPLDPGQNTQAPQAAQTSAQASVASKTTPPVSDPQIADDVDLIEKEWVEKAKDIVNKTKTDPHVQSRELNKFKAEYIKKRFNKDQLTNDQT